MRKRKPGNSPACAGTWRNHLQTAIRAFLCLAAFATAGYIVLSPAAIADVLYSNGGANGEINAFSIDHSGGNAVSNSFTLGSASTVTGVDFAVWLNAGQTGVSVDWAINSAKFSGLLASGSTGLTTAFLSSNEPFDIDKESFSGLNLNLAPGTYWLELRNGVTSVSCDAMWWDENDGASQAFESADGTPGLAASLIAFNGCATCSGSETFQIEGSPAPEPATIVLSGFGLLILAGIVRRQRFT
jgi:hypothetical protein